MPGLQFLRAAIDGLRPAPPITEIMAIRMLSAKASEVVMSSVPQA